MYELSQLRCFIAVAEELHFGRAAERLHMTQPPVSRQVMLLEQILGVQLLKRSNRVVALTAAGRSFLADARRIVTLAEDARLSVQRVASGERGALTLGFIPAAGYELLPRLVALAAREMPGVEIILRELVTDMQIEGLSTHAIDVGLLRPPVDRSRMDALCVARDRMALAIPEAHALARADRLRMIDLQHQPFIMYAPVEGRYHHDLVSAVFRKAEVQPNYVQYARETHTILALVGAGVGLALVPESATRLRPATVCVRALDWDPPIVSQTLLAWRRDNDDPALATFLARVAQPSIPT